VDQPASGEYVEPRKLPLASAGARWLLAAAVLGSGMALLDGTVVNIAVPTIGRELHADLVAHFATEWQRTRRRRPVSKRSGAALRLQYRHFR
jgi:hypothetical protein